MINVDTLLLLIPEFSLVVLATWLIVASAFQPSRWWAAFCGLVLVIVAYGMWRQDAAIWHGAGSLFAAEDRTTVGPLFVDAFGHAGRWLAIVLALLFLPLIALAAKPATSGEYLGAIVLAFTGLMVVAVSADLILMLLGLELISIPTYVLLFLGRSDPRGPEATAKYFFLSILSSAMFLYGLSFLYGAAGSTHLVQIQHNLTGAPDAIGRQFLPLGLLLLLVGLGFKIAAVPFHFYAPDVYQATTHANAALLAVLPKAAGILALTRIAVALGPVGSSAALPLVIVLAIASMTWGNVCALWQADLRRLLAYSSIAHAGYLLIGIAAGLAAGESTSTYDGFGAAFFYLLVYSAGSLGAFAVLAYLTNDSEEIATVEQIAGLPRRHPVAATLLAVFMFSLSGIPPLAGFWGKLTLFTTAIAHTGADAEHATAFRILLVTAALNAAIGAAYYLRVIAAMYFGGEPSADMRGSYGVSLLPGITAALCALLVVGVGLRAGPMIQYARQAGRSLRGNAPAANVALHPPPLADKSALEPTAVRIIRPRRR